MSTEEFEASLPEDEVFAGQYQRDKITANWLDFTTEFLELLDPNSSSGLALFTFIRKILLMYHLYSVYSEAYILNCVYLRAHEAVTKRGQTIQIPVAWIKNTARNIIREQCREHQKFAPLEVEPIQDVPDSTLESELENDLLLTKLAFQRLEPEEQRLLNLKIVQGLSWQEIHHLLTLEGKDTTIAALRKRKERILSKLRRIYHSMKPDSDSAVKK